MASASSHRSPLILYHADCDDGFGAAYAAWLALGDAATYQPIHHDDAVSVELLTGRHVFILDFSFSPAIIAEMAAVATQITLLDHHKSAAEQWQGVAPAANVSTTFDMDRSGAQMSWDHFHPGIPRPRLIEHVADRDLFMALCLARYQGILCWFKSVSENIRGMAGSGCRHGHRPGANHCSASTTSNPMDGAR